MKFKKSGETKKTVTCQADCTKKEIYERVEILISNFKKISQLYFLTHPLYLFKFINYYGVRLNSDYIFVSRSVTTAPIYIYFEDLSPATTELTFKASYLPVFRWALYVSIPLMIYSLYQSFQRDTSTKVILIAIGFCLIIWSFIALLAFGHERLIQYFFKRDVSKIIQDLSSQE